MSYPARFKRQLSLNRLSQTSQRDLIFKTISQAQPITPTQLTTRLEGQVSRATIYLALKEFERAGIITRSASRAVSLTDRIAQHHHTRVCRNCGRRDNFWDEALEKAITHYAKQTHFALEDHILEFTGLCHSCQEHASARTPIGIQIRRPPERIKTR